MADRIHEGGRTFEKKQVEIWKKNVSRLYRKPNIFLVYLLWDL